MGRHHVASNYHGWMPVGRSRGLNRAARCSPRRPAARCPLPTVDLIRASLCTTLHPPPSSWIRSFFKSKVQPPPKTGSLGLLKKSKVQPPPRGSKRPSKSAESGRKMSFSRDLQVILKGIQRGWRVGWTSQKVQGPTPPPTGSLGNLKKSKVHPPPPTGFLGHLKPSKVHGGGSICKGGDTK